MLIKNKHKLFELESIKSLLDKTKDYNDFKNLFSIMCDMKNMNTLKKRKYTPEDFVLYQINCANELKFNARIKKYPNLCNVTLSSDPFEDLSEILMLPERRFELLEIIDNSVLKVMGLDSQVQIRYESNMWLGDKNDHITFISNNKEIKC